jgi:hypothetical protein
MPDTSQPISSLIRRAEYALENGGINTALGVVHDYVEQIITNPICTSHVFASQGLDALCLLIGRYNLARLTTYQAFYSAPLGSENAIGMWLAVYSDLEAIRGSFKILFVPSLARLISYFPQR